MAPKSIPVGKPPVPILIVMSGLAGTGKSTVADGIGQALNIPVLSVDPIEAAIVEAGIARSFETGLAAYLAAEVLAERHLASWLSVVIDAANYVDPGRDIWRRLATRSGAELRVIVCEVSDDAVRRARLEDRDRGLIIPEPEAKFVEQQQVEWSDWPEPHLLLDGTADPARNLALALEFVR
jgi:predicted kinase